jgi:predicted aldo/keto reductase-like oxidoreductase
VQFRPLGETGFKPSALGFGCMRLPMKDKKVDEPAAIEILRYAIDHGVNYFDTAYPYHGGDSERVLGKALQEGYRQKVTVADKMPIWKVKKYEDFDRLFEEQMERLQLEKIDYYLLHNIQGASWPAIRDIGAIEWLEKVRGTGRIDYLGFSFHDTVEVFKEVIDHYDGWDLCQIQYNYVCEEVQAGTEGLKYAADKGLGVVIMEPLFGGTLANPPEPIREVWDAEELDPVDTALKWLWNKPEISVVLSGMSTLDQVKANVASADAARVGALPPKQTAAIKRAQAKYRELSPIPCTRCGYCLPCPEGVAIPENFQLYNNALMLGGNAKGLNHNLYVQKPDKMRAENCVVCRECEEKCPQSIPISEWMPKIHEALK